MHIRLQKVSSLLKKEKADALLVWNHEGSGQPATTWLSGFTGTWSILLITRTRKFLITDGRYTAQSKAETKGWSISIISGQMPALQILHKIIEQEKIGKIIFDGSVTPYSVVEEVQRKLPNMEYISRKRILQELRLVKEKGEIHLLAEAAERAGKAFMRLLPEVKVGMTEKEIAARLETLCTEEGADGFAFQTSVASGKNGALPHAKSTDKEVRTGELITIDFGIRYKGYCSDMTRMLAVGEVGPRLQKMYDAVLRAQELGCRKARGGMTGKEIDAVCRNYLTQKGFGKYFTHSTGHGVGIEVHELPAVSQMGEKGKKGGKGLPAGAVVTIEPGIYIPNVGGVRIEDTLVLQKNGTINLTEAVSKELFIL